MILLCYAKCSTCNATKKELDEHKVSYQSRDIKEDNPSYEELKQWFFKSGQPLKKFFNTSGQLYKSMSLKEKLIDMTQEEQLELLATDGMLVKRPLMVDETVISIGKKDILNRYINE